MRQNTTLCGNGLKSERVAEPHCSVGSAHNLRIGGRLSTARAIFLLGIDDSHCYNIHSSLTAVHSVDDVYVGSSQWVR